MRYSVNAAYLACREECTVSVTALYDKWQGIEPQVTRAVLRESSDRLTPVIKQLRAELPPLLPGYRVKIIDGNHLAGTEHRITETRTLNSAPLPGQALVVLDPSLLLELSGFYLAEEISATYWGMIIAIEPAHWRRQFVGATPAEMAACLRALAANVNPNRFKKRRRGPKRPPPARTDGLREQHVSTKRLLDQRRASVKVKC